MNRIKIVATALLFMSVVCSALTPWGLPTWVDISAYAVNDYSHSQIGNSNLKRSIYHKNRFIDQMQGKLRSKYPNIYSYVTYNRENSTATKNNFLNDNTNNTEFVFFSGHGWHDRIDFYDYNISSGSGKKFGSYTRWVLFDACLTHNASTQQLERWFDGAHAILGYNSFSWEFIHPYNCFFTCNHYRSEYQFDKFASRFVTNGESIWSAFNNSVREAIYVDGGKGVEPVIVYRVGNADNGLYVDFSEERLQNVYNGPFNTNNGASNVSTRWRSNVYGSPTYY